MNTPQAILEAEAGKVPVWRKLALTVQEAAELTSIPATRIREAITDGQLHATVYGGGHERRKYVIRRADLDAWVDRLARFGPRPTG